MDEPTGSRGGRWVPVKRVGFQFVSSTSLTSRSAHWPTERGTTLRVGARDPRQSYGRHPLSMPDRPEVGTPRVSAFQKAGMPTPITPIRFRNRTVFVKRDDLLQFSDVTGSKLRKLHSLFVDKTIQRYDCIVSYGGAQSNAMLAVAHLCKHFGKRFIYITRPTPQRLSYSRGNLREAIEAGMEHVPIGLQAFRNGFTDTRPRDIRGAALEVLRELGYSISSENFLFIPQGGAWTGAEYGIRVLAQELRQQIDRLRADGRLALRKPILFLSSGTGTTAFYLQKYMQSHAKVVTVPVSGDERYLVKQIRWLDSYESNTEEIMKTSAFPNILRPRLRSSFADIRPEKLKIWKELCRSTGGAFEFDLVYAPKTWEEVMCAIQEGRLATEGEDLIYYHSGGTEGNSSMLGKDIPERFVNFFSSSYQKFANCNCIRPIQYLNANEHR
ncbi:Tryptophan synthase beta subunit-like PLP-dependent enzyme [Gracilaria domingensis]|nr:Tryptophan synthase beta subunit-like PLP-dependent enzyme [Gracilaria domingensis]